MSTPRKIVSSEERLEYAKMVVENVYTIVKVAEIAPTQAHRDNDILKKQR